MVARPRDLLPKGGAIALFSRCFNLRWELLSSLFAAIAATVSGRSRAHYKLEDSTINIKLQQGPSGSLRPPRVAAAGGRHRRARSVLALRAAVCVRAALCCERVAPPSGQAAARAGTEQTTWTLI